MRGIMAGAGGNAVMRVPARFLPEMRGDYWSTAGRLQVEEAVEADGQASRSVAGELAHGKQDAGHEAGAVEAVGPNGQLLAGIAEEHFLVGVEAAQTHGVHVDAVDHLAA